MRNNSLKEYTLSIYNNVIHKIKLLYRLFCNTILTENYGALNWRKSFSRAKTGQTQIRFRATFVSD